MKRTLQASKSSDRDDASKTQLTTQIKAIGETPPPECDIKALYSKNMKQFSGVFPEIPEWSREAEEEPQPFHDFLHMQRYKPTTKRKVIYVVPIGEFETTNSAEEEATTPTADPEEVAETITSLAAKVAKLPKPNIDTICKVLSAYFMLEVRKVETLRIQIAPPKKTKSAKKPTTIMECELQSSEYVYPISIQQSKDKHMLAAGLRYRIEAIEILRTLKHYIESDAVCVLGVTCHDIYEADVEDEDSEEDAVLMGRASGDRVGVVSLCRLNPKLDELQKIMLDLNNNTTTTTTSSSRSVKGKTTAKKAASTASTSTSTSQMNQRTIARDSMFLSATLSSAQLQKLWLLTALKTSCHEAMHMFGLDHCVYFTCCMNACVKGYVHGSDYKLDYTHHSSSSTATSSTATTSNSQSAQARKRRKVKSAFAHETTGDEDGDGDGLCFSYENDGFGPLAVCPIDLRKLQLSIGFDIAARFHKLSGVLKEAQLHYEAAHTCAYAALAGGS